MTEDTDIDGDEESTTDDQGPLQLEENGAQDTDGATEESNASDTAEPTDGGRKIVTYVQYSLFVLLLVVVLIATLRFYFAASTAVDRFVSDQFRPLFQAAFNLAILLVSGLGISLLVRRMR